MAIFLVKRGEESEKMLSSILNDGEICYNKTKDCFYVGNGYSPIAELKEFNNIVSGDDGKIYAVSVDSNGVAHAKECKFYERNGHTPHELRTSL